MRKWLSTLPGKLALEVVGGVIVVLIVDHYHNHIRIHTRTWVFLAWVLAAVVLTSLLTRWLTRPSRRPESDEAAPDAGEVVEALRRQVADLTIETDRWDGYAEHLRQILDHLQQLIAGRLPNVTHIDFIQRGILDSGRDMLKRTPHEDVRLSILSPTPDRKEFRMPFAAGHSLAGQQKYRLEIDESISRFAFQKGKRYVWQDLENEPAYKPHPESTRPYRSMISIPIHRGDKIWGVFNVISTAPNSFDDADIEYVHLLGSIINVSTSLILAEQMGELAKEIEGD